MKKKDIKKIFSKLNLKVRSTGHKHGWLIVNEAKILRVHYSHGRGEIHRNVIHRIRGQLKLSQKDFQALITCPLIYDAYLKILKRKGYLPVREVGDVCK